MARSTDESIDRITPTLRPRRKPAGYQQWWDLLFVHWRVPAGMLAPLLPSELTLDTWGGSAWVGLVPFRMAGVRPRWAPALPGISAFPETNLRTYVHFRGRDPGVWFFSLEAARWLAVQAARWGWHLPYYWAAMRVDRCDARIEYHSRRREHPTPATLHAVAEIGSPLGSAAPGTLEHFLIERYLLYSKSSHGLLHRGQVHHSPYPLHEARLLALEETLLAASGIVPPEPPYHVLFSPGVRVEVFGLERV
jgi:hypothetical protein